MTATNPWARIAADAWLLGLEASYVITLRMLKMAAGGAAANAEVHRMFSEKFLAASSLQSQALIGALGYTAPGVAKKSIRHYRKSVRANRRRLTR